MSVFSKQALSFKQTGRFDALFIDYVANRPELQALIPAFPNPKSLVVQAEQRHFSSAQRQVLVASVRRQYASYLPDTHLEAALQALAQEDCLTITTGHQPVLLGGPLFSTYKIITTLQLARYLAKETGKPVVPVFWMATEDHDFEEIQSVQVFGKKLQWDSPQGGAVGRFNCTEIGPLLRNVGLEQEALLYERNADLAGATRSLVHHWFGDQGLLVIDGDDPQLKATFLEEMMDECLHQKTEAAIEKSNALLTELGYKIQAHARPINLFWLGENSRVRILPEEGGFQADIKRWTYGELATEARQNPECLSPNALLRPLYQEKLLPNVAYVGGPGEIAYWLQLKPVFEAFHITMPLVWPRLHGQILTEGQEHKRLKFGFAPEDVFKPFHQLKKEWLPKVEGQLPDQQEFDKHMEHLLETWKTAWLQLDPSWQEALSADVHRQFKSWQELGTKYLKKAEKRNADYWQQMEHWLEKLFPDGNLQERKENLLTFIHQYPHLVQDLLDHTDPFDFSFNLFTYANES